MVCSVLASLSVLAIATAEVELQYKCEHDGSIHGAKVGDCVRSCDEQTNFKLVSCENGDANIEQHDDCSQGWQLQWSCPVDEHGNGVCYHDIRVLKCGEDLGPLPPSPPPTPMPAPQTNVEIRYRCHSDGSEHTARSGECIKTCDGETQVKIQDCQGENVHLSEFSDADCGGEAGSFWECPILEGGNGICYHDIRVLQCTSQTLGSKVPSPAPQLASEPALV